MHENVSQKKRLPISAFVVTFNEAHFLARCLDSISFCEEIVVVDLGSSDESIRVAKSFNAAIYNHERLPSSEYLRPIYVPRLKNDWVLIIDPDEHLTPKLQIEIIDSFEVFTQNNQISNVVVPWVFHFGEKKLIGTPWGGHNMKTIIVNRRKFSFVPLIHNGQRKSSDGIEFFLGNSHEGSFLHHAWMINRSQFLEKHARYLRVEGKSRLEMDPYPKLNDLLISPFKEFLWAYVIKKGFLDGVLGIYLCLFWTKYQTLAKLSHLKAARASR